jgi:hypothetical protein
MNPYLSWAIMLIVAGALGWYYTNGSKSKGKAVGKGPVEKNENIPNTAKQKKIRNPPTEGKHESPANHPKNRSKEQQLKRSTVNLESSSGEFMGSHLSTSSTNGADADDDLSSAGSPVDNVTTSVTDYMSDMLEPPAPGPAVFRLAGSLGSQPKKPKTQSFKQVETKKQRQQKAKNEARKLQVQEAEEQRRKLLEKQLHTAREAERHKAAGTNANPIPSVWKVQATNNASSSAQEAVPAQNGPLLDTFDPSATTSSDQDEARPAPLSQGLPSEEEQLRILGALNSENDWTTVSSKKGKKKNGKADESVSDASTSEMQDFVQPPVPHIPLPDPSGKGHPLDSDWVA